MYIYYSQKQYKHFGLEIQVCILVHLYQNNKIKKKKELFTKICELCQVSQRFQYSQFVYIKTLLSKNGLYFIFLILWHAKVTPSIGMPRYWH